MEAMSAFIGDILVYPAVRETIRDRLEEKVKEAVAADPHGELWLVGHSLGGILCYDYCLQTPRTIHRLYTVGSQVGLFGEFGALGTHSAAGGLKYEMPAKIGRWINIYDPDDMLSFLAEPIFTRVRDIEFDTGAPFPASHSEYWNRPGLYEMLTQ